MFLKNNSIGLSFLSGFALDMQGEFELDRILVFLKAFALVLVMTAVYILLLLSVVIIGRLSKAIKMERNKTRMVPMMIEHDLI